MLLIKLMEIYDTLKSKVFNKVHNKVIDIDISINVVFMLFHRLL